MLNIELIQFDNVPKDGILDKGAYVPVGGVRWTSAGDSGCGTDGFPRVQGHYLMKLYPRDDDGMVRGFIVEAATREELESLCEEEIAGLVRRKLI
jgi:hypothetical protein